MALIGPGEVESIRQYVQVGLDAQTLPDSIILLPGFAGAGEADVRRRDPQVDTRTDPVELTAARNAAALFTAAYILPAFPNIVRERTPDYEYQVQPADAALQARNLRDAAENQLAVYLGTAPATPGFTFITTAPGFRGW